MPALTVRPATPADAEALAAIYNEGIADRVATFETRPRTRGGGARLDRRAPPVRRGRARRRRRRLRARRRRTPTARPTPASASTACTWPARPAGRASAGCLLDEVCRAAEAAGLHKLTSRIFSDNAASIAAHEAAGFVVVGVQRRHGRLDGEWRDCVVVERLLGDAAR